jgi:tetratricopeptide (TPR) repeat protein
VQEYLSQHIRGKADLETLRTRHASWYALLAETAEHRIHGATAAETIGIVDTELDNIRSAIEFCRGNSDHQTLSRFAALHWYWFLRGHWREASSLLAEVRGMMDRLPPRDAGRVYLASGTMHWAAGKLDQADIDLKKSEEFFHRVNWRFGLAQAVHIRGHVLQQRGALGEALGVYEGATRLWREEGDPYWLALLLNDVGAVATEVGNSDRARGALTEALAVAASHMDRHGQGNALMCLGLLERRAGRLAEASAALERAQTVLRELGYLRGLAMVLKHRADLNIASGLLERAAGLLEEGLKLQVEIDHVVGIARSLETMSHLELKDANPEEAAYFLGGACRIREDTQSVLTGVAATEEEAMVAAIEAEIGVTRYRERWIDGHKAERSAVTERALSRFSQRRMRPRLLRGIMKFIRNAIAAGGRLKAWVGRIGS